MGVAGGLALVWASLGVFGAITSAVNEAWGVEKQRSFLKHRLVSFLMLVAGGGVAIVALLFVSAVKVAQATWFGGIIASFTWLRALQSLTFTYAATILLVLVLGLLYLLHPQCEDAVSRRLVWCRPDGGALAVRLRRLLVVHGPERTAHAHSRVGCRRCRILALDLRVLDHPYVRCGVYGGARPPAAAPAPDARRADASDMKRQDLGPQTPGTRRVMLLAAWLAATCGMAAITLVSVEDEIEIGRQANAQVRKEVAEFRDARTVSYIRSVGQRLVSHAQGPKYPYTFSIADHREINAFALPGGPVWIHRGVLQAATSESQVAGVLAHEVAHIAQRHAADQLTRGIMANWGFGLLGATLGNSGGASAAQMAAGLLTSGIFLKFSRDNEREADQVGLRLMRRAGWDGRGMVELFEILRREATRDPRAVEAFFSSHPPPQDRIARLQADAASKPGGIRNTRQFQSIKTRLQRMHAPRVMPRK